MNFSLDVEVLNQNILEDQKKLSEDVFVVRAFKPLKNNFRTYTQ